MYHFSTFIFHSSPFPILEIVFLCSTLSVSLSFFFENQSILCNDFIFFLWPETSTAQVAASDDWVEKQPRTIKESVCQQQMEAAGSKRAKKLGKRGILESEAEHGISAFLLLFSTCNSLETKRIFCPYYFTQILVFSHLVHN